MPTSHFEHLAELRVASERRLAIIATAVLLIPNAIWVFVDASLSENQSKFELLELLRAGYLLIWLFALIYMRRASREGLRLVLFLLALLLVAFVTTNALLRPATNWLPIRMMVLVSIGTFVVFPYQFRRQVIAWLALMASAVGLMWGYYVTMPAFDRLAALLTLVIAGGLGMLVARNRAALDQDLDDAWARERQAIAAREQAIDELRTLEAIIPICSYCHQVRTEVGAWQRMDQYVRSRTDTKFSHGICPACAEKHFPGLQEQPLTMADESGAPQR